MVKTLTCLDKLRALHCIFKQQGMLVGTVAKYMTQQFTGTLPPIQPSATLMDVISLSNGDHADGNDTGQVPDSRLETDIWLAA
jgi:hypothetical protein